MIFSRLFKFRSSNPDDYGKVYAKWDPNGKVYGPYSLEYIILSNWSSWPQLGQFEGEEKWRDFQDILEIIDRLKPTEEQTDFLRTHAPELNLDRIGFKETTELSQKYRIRHEERERQRKAKEKAELPVTDYTKKKLKAAGIPIPPGMTRGKANQLLERKADEDAVNVALDILRAEQIDTQRDALSLENAKNIQAMKKCLQDLKLKGFKTDDKSLLGALALTKDPHDLLYEAEGILDSAHCLEQMEVSHLFSEELTPDTITALFEALSKACWELENASEEIAEKRVFADDADYKLVGRIKKKELQAINTEIFKKALAGDWDHGRDIAKLLRKHAPSIRLDENEE
jgi:hypothetical protein